LGTAAIHLASRDAFDNGFFSWLTKPSLLSAGCSSTMVLSHTKGRLGITATGSLVMSEMTHVLATSRFVRVFETGRYDSRRPIVGARAFSCAYSIYTVLQNSLMHLCRDARES
jgi:hypothetical protein